MSGIRTLSVTSVFPAAPAEVWRRLIRIETLRYIASPLLTFTSVGDAGMEWQAGETVRFHLRLLGILPLGLHTVLLETVDPAAYMMQTREHSRLLPVWNHKITIERIDEGSSRYTDTLELAAGWRTDFVYLFAKIFFRHRHRRWRRLLKRGR